jgi:integral membrane protein
MIQMLKTKVGRLRIVGMLEGASLLFLVFIAVPMKYYFKNPIGSEVVGPIHGALFLLFIFYTIIVAIEHSWKWTTTLIVMVASFVPFGTFIVDKKILSKVV